MRPTAPGRVVTHNTTVIIQSMPGAQPGRQHGAGTLASGVDIPGFGSRPALVVLGHGRGAPNAHAT
jgi:hypothetical protein